MQRQECKRGEHNFQKEVHGMTQSGALEHIGWLCNKCGKIVLHPLAKTGEMCTTARFVESMPAGDALSRG